MALFLPDSPPPLPHEVNEEEASRPARPQSAPRSPRIRVSASGSSSLSFAQLFDELTVLQDRLLAVHEAEIAELRGTARSASGKIFRKEEPVTSDMSIPRGPMPEGTSSAPETDLPAVSSMISGGSMTVRKLLSANASDDLQGSGSNLTGKLAQHAKKVSSNLEVQIRENPDTQAASFTFDLRPEFQVPQEELLRLKKQSLTAKNAGQVVFDVRSSEPPPERKFFLAGQRVDQEMHPCVLRPSSRPRMFWDSLALLLLLYDLLSAPLAVFYFDESGENIMVILQLIVTCYWVCDIPATLMTAAYVNNALLVRPVEIARAYFTSWFIFDILILIPDLVVLSSTPSSDPNQTAEGISMARAVRGGRVFRLLRFLRLLRLVKLLKVVDAMKASVNNSFVLLAFNLAKFAFLMVAMIHVLACAWFSVGDDAGGWVEEQGLQDAPTFTQYVTSVQWALSRVHPSSMNLNMQLRTAPERALAIFACFAALGFTSVFISSITNTMADMQQRRQRQKQLLTSVREYCSSHHVSATHAMRIKRFVEREHSRKRTLRAHLELLESLPQDMLRELFHEARSQSLAHHDFFDELGRKNPAMELDLCCKAVSEQYMLSGDSVFKAGEVSSTMYIIATGKCAYTLQLRAQKGGVSTLNSDPSLGASAGKNRSKKGGDSKRTSSVMDVVSALGKHGNHFVESLRIRGDYVMLPGDSLSEHSLWVAGWKRCGLLEAASDGWLLTVGQEELHKVLQDHPQSLVEVILYARFFVETLNDQLSEEQSVSDLPLSANLDDNPDLREGGSINKRNMNFGNLILVTPAAEVFAAT